MNKKRKMVNTKSSNSLLWAPWRIGYVSADKDKGCVFCEIYKENKDKDNLLLFRTRYSFVLLNKYPYNNGHVMFIPNRHIANYEDLILEEIVDINKNIIIMMKTFKNVLKPQGYNMGVNLGKVAGAGVEGHLHFHLVPRWLGDTNFMPVISETKVIAQSLKELYNKTKLFLDKEKNIHE